MIGRVDELVIDCLEPRALATFWAAVLGGDVLERDDDWVYILRPGWTQLSFQRMPEPKVGKNRMHIDVSRPTRLNPAPHAPKGSVEGKRATYTAGHRRSYSTTCHGQ